MTYRVSLAMPSALTAGWLLNRQLADITTKDVEEARFSLLIERKRDALAEFNRIMHESTTLIMPDDMS